MLKHVSKKIARWLSLDSESGASAVEYGILAALIAVVVITGVTTLGTTLNTKFGSIATSVR